MNCTKNPLIHYLHRRPKVDGEPSNQYYVRKYRFAQLVLILDNIPQSQKVDVLLKNMPKDLILRTLAIRRWLIVLYN